MKRILLFITLVLPLFLAAQKTQKDSAINFVNIAVKNFPSTPLRASVINTAFAKTQRAIMDTLYRRRDSVLYKLNGVERLAFKDSTGGGGVTGLTDNYLAVGNSSGSVRTDSIIQLKTGTWGPYVSLQSVISESNKTIMKMQPPFRGHSAQLPFTFRYHYSPNADGSVNTPMQFGFNVDGSENPNVPGIGFSIEPRFITGGLHLLELHQNVYLPPSPGHAGGESVRILTPTFTVRDSLGNSENQWDMRGTGFAVKTLTDKGYFSASGNGLGTTVGITDVTTGYGAHLKTDGGSPILYFKGVGSGGVDLKFDSIKRVLFSPNPTAPYLNLYDASGTANTWSNMQLEGLRVIRGGTPAKVSFMFSASTSIFDITADHTNGITSFYAPSGGYGMEFYANGSLAMALQYTGRVGIGTATPVASAALDITSTTRGLLIPRLDTAQRNAISSPAMGLQVVSTIDSTINMYDGTRWVAGAKILRGTVTIDIPSASPGTMVEATFTITGAQPGDQLLLSVANGSYPSDGYLDAFISGPNAATVRYINTSMLATVDFPSQPFKYQLFK